MTTGRLTRQELGWLLAQEARGAAKILRQDVRMLSQPPPAAVEIAPGAPAIIPDVRVQTTLNFLDDAIGMLSELEAGPGSKAGRRGRIDLAALLWELSPNAKISIEPGAGTEVFGEEAELRRMLHMLLSQTNFAGGRPDTGEAPVHIRREGEWIRIVAELGPDISASADLERRWLSRMATRMGGSLDLEGGTLSVLLPADASNDQNEVADLKKELEQAQQLGEAYARELAAVFSAGPLPETPAHLDSEEIAGRRFDLLVGVARTMHRVLQPVLRGIQAEVKHLPDPTHALSAQISAGFEIIGELGRIAECPQSEPVEGVDLGRLLRDGVTECEARAARHDVNLSVVSPDSLTVQSRRKALALLVRTLLDHAIAATPKGAAVGVQLLDDSSAVVLRVKDGGTAVPEPSHGDLLEQRADPASLGRPPGLALAAAHAVARQLGASLVLRDSAGSGLLVEVRLGKNG